MNTAQAVHLLQSGGVLVYPTETLYALGCLASDESAARRVAALKGRPESKPFPLVVADLDALLGIAAPLPPDLAAALPRLAATFWPGPLSILVPTRPELPRLVRDATGHSSIRVSPHPTVQNLCRTLADLGGGMPIGSAALIATSANKSGQPATALPEQLDPELLAEVAASGGGSLLDRPWPGGGAPSTLIRITGPDQAEVLRPGAISREALSRVLTLR